MLVQESREIVYFKLPVFISDVFLHLAVLWILTEVLDFEYLMGTPSDQFLSYCILLLVAFCCSVSVVGLKLYDRRIIPVHVVSRAMVQTLLTYIIYVVLVAMVHKSVPRYLMVWQVVISLPVISGWHLVVNYLIRAFRKVGHNTRSVLIIGGDAVAGRLNEEFKIGKSVNGYSVMGFFSSLDQPQVSGDLKFLGQVDDFFQWVGPENRPDEIYCTLSPAFCGEVVKKIIRVCNELFIDFYFVPLMEGFPNRQMKFSHFGRVTVIKLREEPMNTVFCKSFKRIFDVLFSSLFLFLIFPFVVVFVWVGNKLTGSAGPLFFRQVRNGYNGREFVLYKFRSMKVNEDSDVLQASKDDPRKTKFGSFLRSTSIDELPQFINVLRGEMSIIGPRPHMVYHTEVYSKLIGDYMVRHLCKPGITGWAQVNGHRGETKKDEEMADRVTYDIWYIEHWSILLDIEIFFKTLWQILPGHDEQAY